MPRYTFHVITSAAARKGAFGRYGHVAVLRVDTQERGEDYTPAQIRELRGVEVVWVRRRLDVGGSPFPPAPPLGEGGAGGTKRKGGAGDWGLGRTDAIFGYIRGLRGRQSR